MPIRIQCQCGKALSVKDELAGKAVKCPGCGKVIRVPSTAGKSTAGKSTPAGRAPAAQPTSTPASESLSDLFDEEGFSTQVAAICPACKAEMAADAVLCTKCGYHKEVGSQLASHQTAGVDIDHGTLALRAAADSMKKDKRLQKEMLSKAGLPWWGLSLVLFIGGFAVVIAVLTVNAAKRVDQTVPFNPWRLFFELSAFACFVVAGGALIALIAKAFQKSTKEGLLMFTVVYIFYFVFKNFRETWRIFATTLVVGGAGVGLMIARTHY